MHNNTPVTTSIPACVASLFEPKSPCCRNSYVEKAFASTCKLSKVPILSALLGPCLYLYHATY